MGLAVSWNSFYTTCRRRSRLTVFVECAGIGGGPSGVAVEGGASMEGTRMGSRPAAVARAFTPPVQPVCNAVADVDCCLVRQHRSQGCAIRPGVPKFSIPLVWQALPAGLLDLCVLILVLYLLILWC